MPTNKLVLREVDQVMNDFKPIYTPLYPIFMPGGLKHEMQVGVNSFRRLEAVSDLRSEHVTPKDTVLKQLVAKEGEKSFKIYPFASQFVRSQFQDNQSIESFVRQVLDEQNKHMDDLLLLGEGTQDSDVVNNGLFWSGDPNHVTEGSTELDDDQDLAISLHQNVMANAVDADQIAGRKLIMFYGANILPLYRSLYAANGVPFKVGLEQALGPDYSTMEMPAAVTPASSHGWLIVNLDQVKWHHTEVPRLFSQGIDEQNFAVWQNYLMGSCMLDVLAEGAIIKQPATIEA